MAPPRFIRAPGTALMARGAVPFTLLVLPPQLPPPPLPCPPPPFPPPPTPLAVGSDRLPQALRSHNPPEGTGSVRCPF